MEINLFLVWELEVWRVRNTLKVWNISLVEEKRLGRN